MRKKRYSGVDKIPHKNASTDIITGCLVCEGGAFRGVYSSGVTDCLMMHGINLSCCIGVSAGALIGANYISGQIGRAAWFNLNYRHDPRYVGFPAYLRNKGIIGFDYMFNELNDLYPLDEERFYDARRRFVTAATSLEDGKAYYFETNQCKDILQAIRASASMPFMSRPVSLEGKLYLDGGIADKIPYQWALDEGYKRILVIKTRCEDYRNDTTKNPYARPTKMVYERKYPEFAKTLTFMEQNYNLQCDMLDTLTETGRIYTISPSRLIPVTRVEKDMEKLGELYHLGYNDTLAQLSAIRRYLGMAENCDCQAKDA